MNPRVPMMRMSMELMRHPLTPKMEEPFDKLRVVSSFAGYKKRVAHAHPQNETKPFKGSHPAGDREKCIARKNSTDRRADVKKKGISMASQKDTIFLVLRILKK